MFTASLRASSPRVALVVVCWAALVAARAAAQQLPADNRAAALVLEAPASTQAMALGNTPLPDGGDSGLLFYNPALVVGVRGIAAAWQRYGSRSALATVAAATDWASGGIAAGLQVLGFSVIQSLSPQRDAQAVLLEGGPNGVSEFVATIGYGREIMGIRAGVAAKVIEERVSGQRDGTVVVDIGVVREAGAFSFALVGRNLGSDIEIGSRGGRLPRMLSGMIALEEQWVGPLDIAATTSVTLRRDNEVIPAGGVQLSYWPVTGRTFTVRAGVQRVAGDARSPFTFGAALTLDAVTVEYAFQSFDAPGDAHRFGMRWR